VGSPHADQIDKGAGKMSISKHRPKVLVLSVLAAFGLIAFSASAAQAAAGSFLENGVAINALKTGTGTVDTLPVLEVPTANFEIDCTGITFLEVDLLGSGALEEAGVAHTRLLFTGCRVYTIGPPLSEQKTCKVYETLLDREKETNAGNLVAEGLAEVFLHTDGKPYLRVKGINGAEEKLAQIFSKNCVSIMNGTKVTGLIVFQLTPGTSVAYTNAVRQLVEMASVSLFTNNLKFGEAQAFALGSAWVELTNTQPWGIC
jgi:hypothetical protein